MPFDLGNIASVDYDYGQLVLSSQLIVVHYQT